MSNENELNPDERLGLPSASALSIAVACPGQPNLKRSMPAEALQAKEEKPDEWAERGSRIHLSFETGNTDILDAEELETYKVGLQFEEAIVQNWMKDKALDGCDEGPREKRVFLNNPNTLEPIGSAKLDRHYLAPPYMLVIDLKSGFCTNLPPSPRSWQLRFQSVVMWQEYSDLGITDIRVAHCKPKSEYGASDVCDYVVQDLEYSLQSILFHLWETTQPDAVRHAGNWCGYCPCKAWCPEAGAYSLLPSVIANRVADSSMKNWQQMVEAMQGPDLVRIWETSTIIGKIIEAVKARLKAMPKAELLALGLEIGKGRNADAIGDVPEAFKFLVEKFPEKDVLEAMDFGKGALVTMISKHKKLTKEGAGRWWDTNLDKWIARAVTEGSLKKAKE